jgi:peptidoglycan/xylan/chitin deacetylase (PgdA/CDA1 family)
MATAQGGRQDGHRVPVRDWRSRHGWLLALSSVVVVLIMPSAARATVVTLGFDDGDRTQYQVGPILASHGMHATFYINSGEVGSSSYYMTWSQIHDLAADGNEIAGHTLTHPNLTQLTPEEQRRQICDDRTNLLNQGFSPVVSFAYPYDKYNSTTTSIVQECGYTTGRRVGGLDCCGYPVAETIPPLDPFITRTPEAIGSTTSLATMESYVTQAEQSGGGWMQLVFHLVCDGCATLSINPSQLSAFLDWLEPRAASGTAVETVADVMAPRGYARPNGASPFLTSLVPAYKGCSAPNATHGAPLSFASCNPPAQASDYLTLGSPDANGSAALGTALVSYVTVPGDPSTPADEADVRVTVKMHDIRSKLHLSDYTGEVQIVSDLRITDQDNTPSPDGSTTGTVQDAPLSAAVACTSTASATVGSDCSVQTTVNALDPGAVKEGRRSVWELGHVRAYDGGSDGVASTTGDNTLFMDQGLFTP